MYFFIRMKMGDDLFITIWWNIHFLGVFFIEPAIKDIYIRVFAMAVLHRETSQDSDRHPSKNKGHVMPINPKQVSLWKANSKKEGTQLPLSNALFFL